jgi:hypothetical protein
LLKFTLEGTVACTTGRTYDARCSCSRSIQRRWEDFRSLVAVQMARSEPESRFQVKQRALRARKKPLGGLHSRRRLLAASPFFDAHDAKVHIQGDPTGAALGLKIGPTTGRSEPQPLPFRGSVGEGRTS